MTISGSFKNYHIIPRAFDPWNNFDALLLSFFKAFLFLGLQVH